MTLVDVAAALVGLGLVAYAVFGGADFGGGIWDLFARGPRRAAQREAIAHAMGPVWEANHVWLVFAVVGLFAAFPRAWAALATALFVPLRLVLAGVALRGTAFVFRAYAPHHGRAAPALGAVFGASSALTPFGLGACAGALVTEDVRVLQAGALTEPLALTTGLAAVSVSAYLAAVFLARATDGELREDFRRRALGAGIVVLAGAAATLPLVAREAPALFAELAAPRGLAVLGAGFLAAAVALGALVTRRFGLARVAAAAQVAAVVGGLFFARYPVVLAPDVRFADVAAPRGALLFFVASVPFGFGLVVPALVLLFRVFDPPRRLP